MTGTTWLLVEAVVDGTAYRIPKPVGNDLDRSYVVRFGGGHLGGSDGCNSIEAAATLQAGTLTISRYASVTFVFCPYPALRRAYARELFGGSVRWAVSGYQLTLTTTRGDAFDYEPWISG